MSQSFNCKCPERKKPVGERNWRVVQRNCHRSAFAGYQQTYSDYSTVVCLNCAAVGRTKADYVSGLKNGNYQAIHTEWCQKPNKLSESKGE